MRSEVVGSHLIGYCGAEPVEVGFLAEVDDLGDKSVGADVGPENHCGSLGNYLQRSRFVTMSKTFPCETEMLLHKPRQPIQIVHLTGLWWNRREL